MDEGNAAPSLDVVRLTSDLENLWAAEVRVRKAQAELERLEKTRQYSLNSVQAAMRANGLRRVRTGKIDVYYTPEEVVNGQVILGEGISTNLLDALET